MKRRRRRKSTRDGLKYTGLVDEWEFSDLEVTAAESHGLQIWLHDRAFIHQTQTIHSTSYTRNQTRDSTMLQVRYDEVDGEKKYVGVARVFARFVSGDREKPLRVAFCDFYSYIQPLVIGVEAKGTRGRVLQTTSAADKAERLGRREEILIVEHKSSNAHVWVDEFYPVLLNKIDTKLMRFTVKLGNAGGTATGVHTKRMFLKTYAFNSNV